MPSGRNWHSNTGLGALLIVGISIIVVAVVIRSPASPAGPSTHTSTPPVTSVPGVGTGPVTVTGHALYEVSGTEFVFSDGSTTYRITMDAATRCVNLKGQLLGGSQFVSRIAMITSLPLSVTGPRDGSTITAQTVLIPTTKDAIT